ncbi:acyl-CoA desaturase [soil metagenome]|jgi:linoleoyl-CoA desaturase|nr:acyl-CoA desaturase [Actinomycetota bacterium]
MFRVPGRGTGEAWRGIWKRTDFGENEAPQMRHRAMQHLSAEDLDGIAREFDAIHREVRADLGDVDAAHIRRVITIQRGLDTGGRALLLFSRFPPAFVGGTLLLSVSKILDNIEIGHNIMHGQWDWMRDPKIHSSKWEWDAVSPAKTWKTAHNYHHHTFTNVVGKDRDLGYSALRVHADQPWHPVYLTQPIYAIGMAASFEWGIALYDIDLGGVRDGTKEWSEAKTDLMAFGRKAWRQIGKDYVLFPLLAGRSARKSTLLGFVLANVVRNVWTQIITFCGHLPDGAETFTQEQYENESRGGRYVRQLLGSCNLDGSRLFHVMTGHLSYQIEHHLFPGLPSNRYPEIAPRVRAVCERYGLPYSSGRLGRQYLSATKKIVRFAFPTGGSGAVDRVDDDHTSSTRSRPRILATSSSAGAGSAG